MFKLCIYAICKNEMTRIAEWLKYAAEADCIVVLDTGSTDGTWEYLQTQPNIICQQKIYDNFRFDVARNDALSLVPRNCDICLPSDIDMIFPRHWATTIKESWRRDLFKLIIPQYFKSNNCAGTWFAHKRQNVLWQYPVYEIIKGEGKIDSTSNTLIIHDFNPFKDTHNFYPALADLAISENPNDPYCRKTKYLITKEQQYIASKEETQWQQSQLQ